MPTSATAPVTSTSSPVPGTSSGPAANRRNVWPATTLAGATGSLRKAVIRLTSVEPTRGSAARTNGGVASSARVTIHSSDQVLLRPVSKARARSVKLVWAAVRAGVRKRASKGKLPSLATSSPST